MDDPRHGTKPPDERFAEAQEGAVVAAIGSETDEPVIERAIEIARHEARSLVIVDRSRGEGLLSNSFYDDLRSEDALMPRKDATFDASIARREGRNELARFIERAGTAGVQAGGWFPTKSGLQGLREGILLFKGSVLVVPAGLADPNLGDRLKQVDLGKLEELGVRVVTV